jgi:transposase-like protein
MLVAYGIGRDGRRHLLAFLRSQGEGQADWESLLQDLYRRGLQGRSLQLILTDGCAGLGAAIRTVYPRVRHQRCWVHKMRNILEKARKCDYAEVKAGAQAIYRAHSRTQAEAAFLSHPLATNLPRSGAATGARLTRVAVVLRFSSASVAQTAYDQCDRALLRGSAPARPADGLLCQCRKRRPNHLLHFPAI